MVRYSPEHKKATRRRVLKEGGRLIKTYGLSGISVDQIAAAAGLSGAGLYSHFANKNAMMSALLDYELASSVKRLTPGQLGAQVRDDANDGTGMETMLARYLSLEHARDAAAGCVLPAVARDIAVQPDPMRDAYVRTIVSLAAAIDARLGVEEPRDSKAYAFLSAAIGAVALARAIPDDETAAQLLESARKSIAAQMI